MTLADVASELYGVAPGQFVPRRKALVTALRADDRALADEVARLPKPTAAAWAVNHFARVRSDELAALLDLGAQLRTAQADLDAPRLRELTSRAHGVVSGMVRSVADVAAHAGTALGDSVRGQVEQTLRAAMADEQAADAVRRGLLTRSLSPAGFGAVELTGAVAVEPAGAVAVEPAPGRKRHLSVVRAPARSERGATRAKASDDAKDARVATGDETRQHRVRLAAEQALDDLEQARAELTQREEELRAATDARERAAQHADDVREELVRAERVVTAATRHERAARQAQVKAQRRERIALAAAERAKDELDALG